MNSLEGFDTETILGKAVIIATSKEYIEIKSFDDFLNFIFRKEYDETIFMAWNLRYDSDAILKHLFLENPDIWRNIALGIQKQGYEYNGYIIRYIPGKMFLIKKGKKSIRFYDIAQFYEWGKLDTMAKQYLNMQKNDSSNWIEKSIDFSDNKISIDELTKYYNDNKNEIGKYCQLDALLTKKLSLYMSKSFIDLGYFFDNPLSSAKLAEIYIIKNYPYPKVSPKMEKTHEFVKQAFHGGIFESRIRGFIEQEIYEYDLNSAYTYQMTKLDHLANGSLWKVEKPSSKADMGWYICEFDNKYIPYKKNIPYMLEIFFDEHNTFLVPVSDKSAYYCTGPRKQIITKLEYDFIKKYGKITCNGGIEWYKEKDDYPSPFSWLESAYETRKEIKSKDKNDIRQLSLKKMYNSVYGKTAQQKHGYSKLTNFFYASYITAGCRIMVSEIAIKNEKDIIEIATDGIYSLKNLNLKNSLDLGGWETEIYEKGLFLGSGMKQLYHSDNTYETFLRGISNDKKFDLYKLLNDNKNKNEIMIYKKRPIHLNECLIQVNKKNLDDLNSFQDVGRKLSVNTDKKHHWSKEYKNFKDFLKNVTYAKSFNVNEVDDIYQEYINNEGT